MSIYDLKQKSELEGHAWFPRRGEEGGEEKNIKKLSKTVMTKLTST